MSLVVPVYKNSANLPPLLRALEGLHTDLGGRLEVIFVVDGSPDDSYLRLAEQLPSLTLRSQLILLSRNFGSFSAIRAGLEAARGARSSVMAADLQEPVSLIVEFDRLLKVGACDVAVGVRVAREDPLITRLASSLFWRLYRKYVEPSIPVGGVDIFACTDKVREQLLLLRESNSSLVGLLFWVGYRRSEVPYQRRAREIGVSAWTFKKKLRYVADSVYNFSDLPIRVLTRLGAGGLLTSVAFSFIVAAAKLSGAIPVPGYAALVLTITFFGALNCFGLGIIGNYVWRTFDNTKSRPNFIVASHTSFNNLPETD